MRKLNKYNTQEIVLLLFVVYVVLCSTIPQINKLIGNELILIVTTLVSVCIFILNLKEYNWKTILLLGILVINLMVGMFKNNTGIGSILTICNLYMLFIYGKCVKIRKKFIIIISRLIAISEILLIVANKSMYNKNTIGYLYYILLIYFFIAYDAGKKYKLYNKIIKLMVVVFNIIAIYNSDSRATLLGVSVFLIINIAHKVIIEKELIYKVLTLVLILGTIVFPYVYVDMWKNGVNVDIEYSDKKFYSGRQVIWNQMIEGFKTNKLYGIGSNFKVNGLEVLNVHNSLFAVYMIYGIINFIPFFILLLSFIWKMQKNCNNKINQIAIAGIIGMITISYYETNLIWANMFGYFMILTCIANHDFVNEKIISCKGIKKE